MTLAYDSPVWFYVLLVPVFAALGLCLVVMAYALWQDTKRHD